jgi:urease accessory protein
MVLVGWWAAQQKPPAVWPAPTSFVLSMLAGAATAALGYSFGSPELGIALSLVALGSAVAFCLQTSTAVAVTAVALAGFFHGQAHGTEMPMEASAFAYFGAFLLTTVSLHALGILAGRQLGRWPLYRFVGLGSAIAGALLLNSV